VCLVVGRHLLAALFVFVAMIGLVGKGAVSHVVIGRALHSVEYCGFLWVSSPRAIFEPMQISENVIVSTLGIYDQVDFTARKIVNIVLGETVALERIARKFSDWKRGFSIWGQKWDIFRYGVRVIKNDGIRTFKNGGIESDRNFLCSGFPRIFKINVPLNKFIFLRGFGHSNALDEQRSSFVYNEVVVAVPPLEIGDSGVSQQAQESQHLYYKFRLVKLLPKCAEEFLNTSKNCIFILLGIFFTAAGFVHILDMAPRRRGFKFLLLSSPDAC
jgi:hypothetical protein